VAPDVEPTLRTSVRDTFAILAPERGARVGERLSFDFDRRVRFESGEVAFPFQSFPDSGDLLSGECRLLFTHCQGDTLNSIVVDMSVLSLSIVRVVR